MPRKRGVYRQLDITSMTLLVADAKDEQVIEKTVTIPGRYKEPGYLKRMASKALNDEEPGRYTVLQVRDITVKRDRYMMPEAEFFKMAVKVDGEEVEQ